MPSLFEIVPTSFKVDEIGGIKDTEEGPGHSGNLLFRLWFFA